MASSSGWLARSLPLLALPLLLRLSLSLSLSLLFHFPPPSSLPCASGRRFRKRICSRFRTRKTTGAREEHSRTRTGTQTPSGGSERRQEAEANGSQCAVQVVIALLEEGLNQRFFFFLKERDFFRSLAGGSSRVQRNCRRLLRERGRGREIGGRGKKEKKR